MSLIKVNLPSKVAMDGVYVPREVISAIKEKDPRFAAMVIEQAKNATSIEQVKKFLKDKTNGIYSRAAQWGLTEWNKVESSAAKDGVAQNTLSYNVPFAEKAAKIVKTIIPQITRLRDEAKKVHDSELSKYHQGKPSQATKAWNDVLAIEKIIDFLESAESYA